MNVRLQAGANAVFGGLCVARVLDVALYVALARGLGVEAFGRYAYALSFALLFHVIGDLGLAAVFRREVARTPERVRELLRSSLWIKLALAAVTLAAVTGAARLDPAAPSALPLIGPIVAGMLVSSAASLFDDLLRVGGRGHRSGAGLALQSAATLIAGMALMQQGAGAKAGALAYLAGSSTRLALAAWWSRDLWSGPPADGLASGERGTRMRELAPLGLSTACMAGWFRADAILLMALRGEQAVGLLAGAWRIVEALAAPALAARWRLLPRVVRAGDEPPEALLARCRPALGTVLLGALAAAAVVTLAAPWIVTATLGPAYAEAAPALAILVWALPAACVGDTLRFVLAARGGRGPCAWAAGAVGLWGLALNLALLPGLGLVGAAIAAVASEWSGAALLLVMVRAQQAPMPAFVGRGAGSASTSSSR